VEPFGAIGDHRRQFPRLDELGERPQGVGRPHLSQVIGVVLDEADDVGRLGDPIDDVGRPAVGSRPAADDESLGAEPDDPVEVRLAVRGPALQIILRRRDGRVIDEHAP
jgi:hypothetical protein